MTRRMIPAEELALLLGLVDDDGKPASIEGIKDKAASKAWPSRLVNGKLRFLYPDDVDAIFEICKRGPEDKRLTVVPTPRQRTPKAAPSNAPQPSGMGGFRDLPLAKRRGSA